MIDKIPDFCTVLELELAWVLFYGLEYVRLGPE